MSKRSFLYLLILFISFCFIIPEVQAQGDTLIVRFAYAQGKIRQGEIWKIYLSVADPDARLSRIVCNVEQAGAERYYKPSIIYLKKGMEKQFAGYLALHTNASQNLSGEELTFNLSILDRAGNVRKTLRFPLEFDGEQMRPLPAEMEKELNQRIGMIDVDFDLTD